VFQIFPIALGDASKSACVIRAGCISGSIASDAVRLTRCSIPIRLGEPMKFKKLLDRLDFLLFPERRQRALKKRKLKDLLSAMKLHERELGERLDITFDEEGKAGLRLKKEILHEQRKKGVRLLRSLKRDKG